MSADEEMLTEARAFMTGISRMTEAELDAAIARWFYEGWFNKRSMTTTEFLNQKSSSSSTATESAPPAQR